MIRCTLVLLGLVPLALCFSNGAPAGACVNLFPCHGASPEVEDSPFTISGPTSVKSGSVVELTLGGNGNTFKGYIIRAYEDTLGSKGKFQGSTDVDPLTCDGDNDSASHSSPEDKTEVKITWTAPNYSTTVRFNSTVVPNFSTVHLNKATYIEVVQQLPAEQDNSTNSVCGVGAYSDGHCVPEGLPCVIMRGAECVTGYHCCHGNLCATQPCTWKRNQPGICSDGPILQYDNMGPQQCTNGCDCYVLNPIICVASRSSTLRPITEVYDAAHDGDVSSLEVLLAHGGNPNLLNNGDSPLLAASLQGHEGVVRALINAGVDIGYARPRDGLTALHVAAYYNQAGIVRLLLQSGADKRQLEKHGYTPTDVARQRGNNEIADIITNW